MRGATVRVALLDDGNRKEMEQLAARYGARYVRRSVHSGAKAGNINHALGRTDAPFVARARLRPRAGPATFLERTLPRVRRPAVAFVQTPQYYANNGEEPARRGIVEPAGAVLRADRAGQGRPPARCSAAAPTSCSGATALEAVGGFPSGSLTEDFALSIDLHERRLGVGVRARGARLRTRTGGPRRPTSASSTAGRAAASAPSRACCGRRCRCRQKLQYLLSASYFLSGWTVLVYLSLPVIRIVTGVQPLAGARPTRSSPRSPPYFALSLATVASVGGGHVHVRRLLAGDVDVLDPRPRDRAQVIREPSRAASSSRPRPATPAASCARRRRRSRSSACSSSSPSYGLARDQDAATLNNVAFAGLHISILFHGVLGAVVPGLATAAVVTEVEDLDEAAA